MSLDDVKVARQIVAGKRVNFIDGTIYHKESIIYKKSNERIEAYYHHLQDKEKVLSVIASGDQVLNCILGGSKIIDLFDISVFPKYFLFLKIGAIKALSREEYLEFFYGNIDRSLEYEDLYNKIRLCLEPNIREFWDGLFNLFEWKDIYNSSLFMYEDLSIKKIVKQNKYLGIRAFNKLKKVIDDVKFTTIEGNIFDIASTFKGKYDLVYLSNILFYSDYELYKKMIKKFPLSKDGIVISYLHSTSDLIKEVFNDKRITFEEYKPYGGMMVYRKN